MTKWFLFFLIACFLYPQVGSLAQGEEYKDMVFIPAGNFTAGLTKSNDASFIKECQKSGYKKISSCEKILSELKSTMLRPGPVSVFVKDFYIDIYEISVEQYLKCIDSGACNAPEITGFSCPLLSTYLMYQQDPIYADHPINCVTFQNAQDYCQWKNKRLPSIDEWEKAARGSSDDRFFPWGNDSPSCNKVGSLLGRDECLWFPENNSDICWNRGPSHPCYHATRLMETTWPIDSKPQGISPYGVFHMAGNVKEWVRDTIIIDDQINYFVRGSHHSDARMDLNVFGSFLKPSPFSDGTHYIGFRCAKSAE